MQVQWKSERMPDKTTLHGFVCLFFCCKDLAVTLRMHMHMLTWNFVVHMD